MSADVKLDIFILGLVLLPMVVAVIKPLRKTLRQMSKSGLFSPVSSAVAAGVLFVHNADQDLMGLVITSLAFILFFANYAVAMSSLTPDLAVNQKK